MGDQISYYLNHWNDNMFSISILITLVLMLSGYFYGKIFQKYIKVLKRFDCTFLGVFFILALFQIYTFYAISLNTSTDQAYYLVAILICASPILCLILWVNPLPDWHNLFGFLFGIGAAIILAWASSSLTTNNVFFDSVYYLSEVIENMSKSTFGHIYYYSGEYLYGVDRFHDFQGFYYFWAMILRWAKNLFNLNSTITPVYIWSASLAYYAALGNTVYNAVITLYHKLKWWGLIISVAILAPYYTNYFNTTLAFFGNSWRAVILGMSMMLIYLLLKTKETLLFIPLTITYYAGICASSSSMFMDAFLTAGLLFYMAFRKREDYRCYIWLTVSILPLVHYALLIFATELSKYWEILGISIAVVAIVSLIAWLLRQHMDIVTMVIRILFPIILLALLVLSYKYRDSIYGYSYFFSSRSLGDMTVNLTSHVNQNEFIRNIVFYILLIIMIIGYKTEKNYKLFLSILALLFLNPAVEPAVAHYLTSDVYSRSFDLIINPFSFAFVIYCVHKTLKPIHLNWVLLPIAGAISVSFAYTNLTVPYSNQLVVQDPGYNWENKVTSDAYDLYQYIANNIAMNEDAQSRPVFLSQDVGLKGYVPNIKLAFNTSDYRDALSQEDVFQKHKDMVLLLSPAKRYDNYELFGQKGDYDNLSKVLYQYGADYLVIRNTIALKSDRGDWYEHCYYKTVNSGQASVVYQNDTWALLKINTSYIPDGLTASDFGKLATIEIQSN